MPLNTPASIRRASPNDLDALVQVHRTTLDPTWDYLNQHWREYPQDSVKLLYQHLLDPSYEDWRVMIAEATTSSQDPSPRTEIVGLAVWNLSYYNRRERGAGYMGKNGKLFLRCRMANRLTLEAMLDVARRADPVRRDVNFERRALHHENGAKETGRLFDDTYGLAQLRLRSLHVHSRFHRQDFGSSLVYWGMEFARQNDLAVTVNASPMGTLLYTSLGFRDVGGYVVQVAGEKEKVESRLMVLEINENKKSTTGVSARNGY